MNAFSGFGPAIAAGRSGYGAVSMAVASGRVQLVTIRQESLSLARWRLLWVALGFVFVTLLALVRIGYLGASDNGARGTSLEEALHQSQEISESLRHKAVGGQKPDTKAWLEA